MDNKTPNDREAQLTLTLFSDYESAQSEWKVEAIKCHEYRLGNQIPADIADMLRQRGQAPLSDNVVHYATEQCKALLTYNHPRFQATAREDSDVKVANIISSILEYIWYISDGNMQLKMAIDDYLVKGKGYLYVYFDPADDLGRGEVKIGWLDSMCVYVDPQCKDRYERDANHIIISKIITREQAYLSYPDKKGIIKDAESCPISDYKGASSDLERDKMTFLPDDVVDNRNDSIRIFERYTKINVKYYRVFDRRKNKEDLMLEKDYREFVQQNTYVYQLPDGSMQYFDNPEEVIQALQMIMPQMNDAQLQQAIEENPVKTMSIQDLVDNGIISVAEIIQTRIKRVISAGSKFLYSDILPCSNYPIAPIPNIWTGTPYPKSDVRMAMDLQDFVNKMRSLIIAHATATTNIKTLLPKGTGLTKEQLEIEWGKPNAVLEYDPTMGEPHFAQPAPFPSELYRMLDDGKHAILYQFGVLETSHGDAAAAPPTFRGTMLIDEFGQRRMKSKLDDIEGSLNILAKVVLEYIQNYYTIEKTIRLVNPNNAVTSFTINQSIYDDYGNEVEKALDITVGRYDVQVISGSSLPTNRMLKLEAYLQLYEKGIIGPRMVLTATDIVDVEKALAEIDMISKQQQVINQLQEEIKKLKGDLQTRDRETVESRKRVEVEKFGSKLDKILSELKANKELVSKRAQDMIDVYSKKLNMDIKNKKENL